MLTKKFLVLALLLSANLGVDAISEKRTKKLYRKAGRWQQKLRDVWALLGVKPFIVERGKVGEACVLKSKVAEDYVLKSAVSTDYVRKSEVCAGVVVEGDVGGGVGGADEKESLSPRKTVDAISEKRTKKLYRKAGKFQKKLRRAWALLGVRPYLVQPGEDGDECVLTSKVEEDYVLKSAVEAEYVLKSEAETCKDCDGVLNGPNKGDCAGDCSGTKENDACGACPPLPPSARPASACAPPPLPHDPPSSAPGSPPSPLPLYPSTAPPHNVSFAHPPSLPPAGVCGGDGSFCANNRVAAAALGAIVEAVGTPEAASAFFAEAIDGLAADAVTAVKPPTTTDDGSVVVGFTLKPDADNFKDGDCTDEFKEKMKAAIRAIMTGVGTDAVLVVTCAATVARRRRLADGSFDVDVEVAEPTASASRRLCHEGMLNADFVTWGYCASSEAVTADAESPIPLSGDPLFGGAGCTEYQADGSSCVDKTEEECLTVPGAVWVTVPCGKMATAWNNGWERRSFEHVCEKWDQPDFIFREKGNYDERPWFSRPSLRLIARTCCTDQLPDDHFCGLEGLPEPPPRQICASDSMFDPSGSANVPFFEYCSMYPTGTAGGYELPSPLSNNPAFGGSLTIDALRDYTPEPEKTKEECEVAGYAWVTIPCKGGTGRRNWDHVCKRHDAEDFLFREKTMYGISPEAAWMSPAIASLIAYYCCSDGVMHPDACGATCTRNDQCPGHQYCNVNTGKCDGCPDDGLPCSWILNNEDEGMSQANCQQVCMNTGDHDDFSPVDPWCATSSIDKLCCADSATPFGPSTGSASICCIQGDAVVQPSDCDAFPGYSFRCARLCKNHLPPRQMTIDCTRFALLAARPAPMGGATSAARASAAHSRPPRLSALRASTSTSPPATPWACAASMPTSSPRGTGSSGGVSRSTPTTTTSPMTSALSATIPTDPSISA